MWEFVHRMQALRFFLAILFLPAKLEDCSLFSGRECVEESHLGVSLSLFCSILQLIRSFNRETHASSSTCH